MATDSFTISDQMVIQDTVIFMPYDDYISYGAGQEYVLEKVYEFPDTPWPMTVNVYLTCRVKHRQSVRGIEASLSGLADGFYLSRIVRTTEEATIEFEDRRTGKKEVFHVFFRIIGLKVDAYRFLQLLDRHALEL